MTEDPKGIAPPPKEDPESLVLRGRPRPVIRFRRGLIIAVAGSLSVALVGLTWLSLKPTAFRLATSEQRDRPQSGMPPDALANAPAAYSDVPQLGPPLPGDLGRPILARQRRGNFETPVGEGAPDPEPSRMELERQRRQSEEAEALASSVLVPLSRTANVAQGPKPDRSEPADSIAPSGPPLPGVPAAQQHKADFARSGESDLNPGTIVGPPSPWTLTAGTLIPASLVTGLNSDLPGMVIAQVTENVRDSATGRTILIPQGARLLGKYDSAVAFGQKRALLVWTRLLFPSGASIQLDTMPATDSSGYAGLEDKIDFHEGQLLKGVALATLLGVGTELAVSDSGNELVRALRESAQQNGARAGDQIVSRNLDVQPTLTVRPGWRVLAIVNKDLILEPWRP